MITKEIAVKAGEWNSNMREFHYTGKHDCSKHIGARGGIKINITTVRVSGKCKTWVRSPDRFHLPVKYGLYESFYIDENNGADFHLPSECPLLAGIGITDERAPEFAVIDDARKLERDNTQREFYARQNARADELERAQ